jgi:hypothetical protein
MDKMISPSPKVNAYNIHGIAAVIPEANEFLRSSRSSGSERETLFSSVNVLVVSIDFSRTFANGCTTTVKNMRLIESLHWCILPKLFQMFCYVYCHYSSLGIFCETAPFTQLDLQEKRLNQSAIGSQYMHTPNPNQKTVNNLLLSNRSRGHLAHY